jgi:branched-chain amino acid transport system substrate-binding protein
MIGRGSTRIHRLFSSVGVLASLVLLLAGCSVGGGGGSTGANTSPIVIGVSLSLSGDFSADGQAFQQGYQLWADYTNAHGGIMGRQVQLKVLSDASDPQQVTTNYQTLINTDKVDLVFGPFSTLLTKPASVVANRYGYALVEGAGGGPSVFQQGLNNVFDVSLPVANNLVTFANYITNLPADQRPKTAAYATEDDPFTQPQVDIARGILEKAGIQTVYSSVYPAETTDFTPIGDAIIAKRADIVITGTLLPDIASFIKDFKQQHYNPKALIATAGPDQGTQFTQAIGGVNVAEGVLVPNGWWPDLNAPQNATLVQAYIAKYGGDKSGISADVAEAWSVGQVVKQAVEQNQSLDQTKLIATLHSGTFQSCQGPVKFDSTGQNTLAQGYLFQWQNGQFIPVFPQNVATAPIQYPKANWT